MSTAMKWAIALGALSFAVTLWVLRSNPGVPESEPAPEPAAAAREAVPPTPARAAPSDFDSAMRVAAEVGSTREGLKYQDEAGPVLSTVLQDRLAGCLIGSSAVGQPPFAIVVGVAPDGSVTSKWASPESPLASCVLHRLAGAALPRPTIPDVWMAANITPDPEESEPDR